MELSVTLDVPELLSYIEQGSDTVVAPTLTPP